MKTNDLTQIIIGKAIDVHRALGPGLLESAYQQCLFYELTQSGLTVEEEVPMKLTYKDIQLDQGYRIDLLVNRQIVLEIKSVEQLDDVHTAQVLTYMKLGGFKLGLLMNFNSALLKEGIKRFIF